MELPRFRQSNLIKELFPCYKGGVRITNLRIDGMLRIRGSRPGKSYPKALHMVWDKQQILKSLKKLHKDGADLSYNAFAASHQSLVSTSADHLGSYRSAIEKRG